MDPFVERNLTYPNTTTVYDPSFEVDFSRLNLSSHQFEAPSSDRRMGSAIQSQYLDNLQRLRFESAVRGQQVGPRGGFPTSEGSYNYGMPINSGDLLTYEEFKSVYNRDARNIANRNRDRNGLAQELLHGVTTRPTRNGYRANVFESENLMSSLYKNNSVLNTNTNTNSNVQNRALSQLRSALTMTSLESFRGNILELAKDQNGCRYLQKKFEEGKPEEIDLIFSEVKDHVRELMIDQFGNYCVQKFFEVCNEQKITQILVSVINDDRGLKAVCLDMHGTRAMQKLLEHLTNQEQRSLVVSVLRRIAVTLTKSVNGHHVIQHCLKFFSSEDIKNILEVVADNCLGIATDKSGCCVLQQCVAHAQGEPKQRLLAEITANALVLSEDSYGNYVVQYILGMGISNAMADILAQLAGSFVSLSMNKYGSNVVEKCLRESSEDQASRIIWEITHSPNLLMVLQDPYGNYVAQSALALSKEPLRQEMINRIQENYPFLHSHPHGKRVLARSRQSKQQMFKQQHHHHAPM